MKKRIFITATNTDIGKTYTTLKLMESFSAMGLRVGVVKPIETGVVDGIYPDGDLLLAKLKECNSACLELRVEDVVPISYELPAAPYIASGGAMFDFTKVTDAIEKMEALCDIVLIEGAGGLYVPIDYSFMMIDLIQFLKAHTLLVTHCSLGCINDTLLSEEALAHRKIAYVVAFNCRKGDDSFKEISLPYFLKHNYEVFQTASDIDGIAKQLLKSFEPPTLRSL
jgi:dethiobiotin synthetase